MENVIKICSIEEALAYKSDKVVYKFMEKYDVSFEESEEIFENMKKWLWLCAKGKHLIQKGVVDFNFIIDTDMIFIDMMWHTFILFTKDYHDFCMDKFGFFIHHVPTTKFEKEEFQKKLIANQEKVLEDRKALMQKQYGIIFDLLGEDTLKAWYEDFPVKYSVANVNKLAKDIS